MDISLLCSDRNHPIFSFLNQWAQQNKDGHRIKLHDKALNLHGGDFLFLISCTEIVPREIYSRYRFPLVIHESDLPEGRGWSPLAWQILAGKNDVVVSLIEVAEQVDRGAIWKKSKLSLEGHELLDEINQKLFLIKLSLIEYAISHYLDATPSEQDNSEATYYPRRTPNDSKIDPHKSIEDQFSLLRIIDKTRYPAFFELRGYKYNIYI